MPKIKIVIPTTFEFNITEQGIKDFESSFVEERVEFEKNPSGYREEEMRKAIEVYEKEGTMALFLHNAVAVFQEHYIENGKELSEDPDLGQLDISNVSFLVTTSGEVIND